MQTHLRPTAGQDMRGLFAHQPLQGHACLVFVLLLRRVHPARHQKAICRFQVSSFFPSVLTISKQPSEASISMGCVSLSLRECFRLICAESCRCLAFVLQPPGRWLGTRLNDAPCITQGSCWAQRHPSGGIAEPNLLRTTQRPSWPLNIAHSAVLGAGIKKKICRNSLLPPCSSAVFQNAITQNWVYCSTNSPSFTTSSPLLLPVRSVMSSPAASRMSADID